MKARQRQTYAPCGKLAGVPKYTEEATSKKQIPEDPLLLFFKRKTEHMKKKVSEISLNLPQSKPEPLAKELQECCASMAVNSQKAEEPTSTQETGLGHCPQAKVEQEHGVWGWETFRCQDQYLVDGNLPC